MREISFNQNTRRRNNLVFIIAVVFTISIVWGSELSASPTQVGGDKRALLIAIQDYDPRISGAEPLDGPLNDVLMMKETEREARKIKAP